MAKGRQIKTLRALKVAVEQRKAITVPGTNLTRLPAALAFNFIGSNLLSLFERGMYIYKPEGKKSKYGRLIPLKGGRSGE